MNTDLNDLPAWAVQRMNGKDAENALLRAENAHLERHVERLARELDYAEQQNELVRRNAIDDVMYRLGEVLKASLEEANR